MRLSGVWVPTRVTRLAERRARAMARARTAFRSAAFCGLHVRGDRELFASQLIAFLPFLHSLDLAFDVDDDDTGNGSSGTESDK